MQLQRPTLSFFNKMQTIWKRFTELQVVLYVSNARSALLQRCVYYYLRTLCVAGERKLTLSTAMVTKTENETSTIVKRRYLPRSGTANDVGGIISDSRRKKTPKESIMLIESDTWRVQTWNCKKKK